MGFTVSSGRIAALDALADPERLARLDLDRDLDGAWFGPCGAGFSTQRQTDPGCQDAAP